MAKMSELESKVLGVLKILFPNDKIDHNKGIGKGYKVDFIVHGSMDIAIECHGKQHFEYVDHFHKDDAGWLDQMRRDEEKLTRIMDLGMPFVEIFYDEAVNKETVWRKINKSIDLFNLHHAASYGRPAQYEYDLDYLKTKRDSYYFLARREKEASV